MKTMITWKRTLIVAAVALLLVPLTLEALPRGPRGRGFGHGPHHGFMGRVAGQLELSEGQRSAIRGILEAELEANAGLREQLGAKREAVFEASHAEPLDENAIRAAVLDAAALQAELAVSRARTRSEVWAQLTPEQQAKATEMKETMKEFREQFGGDGRGPRPGWRFDE